MEKKLLLLLLLFLILLSSSQSQQIDAQIKKNFELANKILENQNYTKALDISFHILKSLNAGFGYPGSWIRDLNTFIELALKNVKQSEIREVLIKFCKLQAQNGSILDGFNDLGFIVFKYKNSVETDQETSFISTVYQYIKLTNDSSILDEVVDGSTVLERLRLCNDYLLNHRFSNQYGLIFGGTTIDWGDIQPEDDPGADFNNFTHPAIDIYDNSMWVIAITNLIDMTAQKMPVYSRYLENFLVDLKNNIKKYLWDEHNQKYIPHIYLEKGSPFEPSFNENQIYYLGGTTIACQAGLHDKDQILQILKQMEDKVVQAGNMITIGLSVFPPYPKGIFLNPHVGKPYRYQNAGDWTWFGGRMIQTLINYGFIEEADKHLTKMVKCVVRDNDYFEWYDQRSIGKGSARYHGSAGVMGKAIQMIQKWAYQQQNLYQLNLRSYNQQEMQEIVILK